MKWSIVYRKNCTGVFRAVATFMFHADATHYVAEQLKLEPNTYYIEKETVSL